MRQPLGTGLPRKLTGNNTQDTVYDLRTAPSDLQSRVNLVTLYAFIPGGTPGASVLDLSIIDSSPTTVLLGSYPLATNLIAYQDDARACRKILDRFPLRGEAAIQVTTDALQANQLVYVFGFVELEGVYEPPRPTRPFQPGALVSPYTYMPVYSNAGVPGSGVVHAFEEGYIDEVTLTLRATGLASPLLTFSDGAVSESLDLVSIGTLTDTDAFTLLEGIPMQAIDAGAGITYSATEGPDILMVWGSFTRR
jgi:hypothetical protein